MCKHETVNSAARLIFQDNVERYFITNKRYYWLLNLTDDLPDEHLASILPFDFNPDVAIVKDTTTCKNGYRSLLLIQVFNV